MNEQQRSKLQSKSYDSDYYFEHRAADLDYLNFGQWQIEYGLWLIESLGLENKHVLDVGCACGSIAWGLRAKAHVWGVDLNNYMIELGRRKFKGLPLYVCDSINLHLFADNMFDLVHTAQVAEHFRPEHVPLILREWNRVLKPGGLVFCCLDTAEQFAREGRQVGRNEDPTHICVKPQSYWRERFREVGWQDVRSACEPAMLAHQHSFLKRYNWDWFLYQKPAG